MSKDIDDIIDDFVESLEFDDMIKWANYLEIETEFPPLDDMYPDWINEIKTEIGEVMGKVFL